ncbi:MAG TPA: MFS transporter, partial [Rugosimonospora sp.]|nr:MFS transporter [Rugosimonospora sp.]
MAAAMAGAWALARVKLADAGTAAAMFGSITALCLVAAGIAVVPTLGWLIPVMVLGGALNGVLNTAVGVLLGSRVPAAARGRAYALLGALVNGASAAGLLLGGVLLGVLAVRTTLAVAGLGGFAVALVLAGPTLRAIARERAAARPAPTADMTRAAEPAGVS